MLLANRPCVRCQHAPTHAILYVLKDRPYDDNQPTASRHVLHRVASTPCGRNYRPGNKKTTDGGVNRVFKRPLSYYC